VAHTRLWCEDLHFFIKTVSNELLLLLNCRADSRFAVE
jgi:hypothetical protein